ncbi:MAG TPA: serine hydrolase, partial [Novosphingobium sp.]|nr:serine hydrolase [Novosphingobium sp.]
PALATDDLEQAFDKVFGAQPAARPAPAPAAPVAALPVGPASSFEARLAGLANAAHGRIGVAALDLSTGSGVSVMGDQPFPMASTVKVAIVATFLEGVDQGRFRLTDRFPLMIPVPSRKFSSSVAPVHAGQALSALELIELAITRSDNRATDALLAAIGGPQAVDRWLHRAKIGGIHVNRDIATLVRDDGGVDPATTIDLRDSATPQAMATLLAGLYQGQWLSMASREVLLGAMSRCLTGVHRMKALVPDEAIIGHKTGTLSNTSSDVGFIRTADGHTVALAIYVTGQGSRPGRESRIATIARAVYDNFSDPAQGGSRVSLN